LQKQCEGKDFLKVSKLCHSLGGLNIPILTVSNQISDMTDDHSQFKNRKLVFISGRIHPG